MHKYKTEGIIRITEEIINTICHYENKEMKIICIYTSNIVGLSPITLEVKSGAIAPATVAIVLAIAIIIPILFVLISIILAQ